MVKAYLTLFWCHAQLCFAETPCTEKTGTELGYFAERNTTVVKILPQLSVFDDNVGSKHAQQLSFFQMVKRGT